MYDLFDFDYKNVIFEWDDEKPPPISKNMEFGLKQLLKYLLTKIN